MSQASTNMKERTPEKDANKASAAQRSIAANANEHSNTGRSQRVRKQRIIEPPPEQSLPSHRAKSSKGPPRNKGRPSTKPSDCEAGAVADDSSSDEEFHNGWRRSCLKCNKIGNMLLCEGCPNVMHLRCAGLTRRQADEIDKWYCTDCEPKTNGKSKLAAEGNDLPRRSAKDVKNQASKPAKKSKAIQLVEPPKSLFHDDRDCLICGKQGDVILCNACSNGTHLSCSNVEDPATWKCLICQPPSRRKKAAAAVVKEIAKSEARKPRVAPAVPSASKAKADRRRKAAGKKKEKAKFEEVPGAISAGEDADDAEPTRPKKDSTSDEEEPEANLSQDVLSMLEVCKCEPRSFFRNQVAKRPSDIEQRVADGTKVPFGSKLLCALLMCELKPSGTSARSYTNKLAQDLAAGCERLKYRDQVRSLEHKLKTIRAIEEFELDGPLTNMTKMLTQPDDSQGDEAEEVAHAGQSLAYLQSVLDAFKQRGLPIEAMSEATRTSLDSTCWTVLEAITDVIVYVEYLSSPLADVLMRASKLMAKLHAITDVKKLLGNGQIRSIYHSGLESMLLFMQKVQSSPKSDVALACLCDIYASTPALHTMVLEQLNEAVDANLKSIEVQLASAPPGSKAIYPQESLIYCLEAARAAIVASHAQGTFGSLRDSKAGRNLVKSLESGIEKYADKIPLTSMILFDCLAQLRAAVPRVK
eukprot:TRINITY_DN6534_c0_g1_i1.p1 TRINITY_DN6534_c0_g1~~TRINITY_DN6534_c0_g1_i1.p1  ORF type:complete len:698 (+),score=138.22 TRINITY_DN6534_c0_g1_i1:140-2233(+)